MRNWILFISGNVQFMEYKHEGDRFEHGFDAGNIEDGLVVFDPERKEYVIMDEDGRAFSTQDMLRTLIGRKVRLTCISFEAIESLEKLMAQADKQDEGQTK